MPETTEARDIIDTAQEACGAQQLDHGLYYDGLNHQVVDIREQLHEEAAAMPDRKVGTYTVTDVASFAGYLAKHGQEHTEVWGSRDNGIIKAVIDAPSGDELGANHEEHEARLQLRHSPDWIDWTRHDGKMHTQLDLAEFIEDHLPNFLKPAGADMLELAQTFQATTKVDFASSQRVKSGETSLNYTEQQDAKAGAKGSLAIPDTFQIAAQVYENGAPYKITARFRYRINGGQLTLGYKLTRPHDVLQAAYDDLTGQVEQATGRTIWSTP